MLATSSCANALAAGYTASRVGRISWYRALICGDSGETVAPVSSREFAREDPMSRGRRKLEVAEESQRFSLSIREKKQH